MSIQNVQPTLDLPRGKSFSYILGNSLVLGSAVSFGVLSSIQSAKAEPSPEVIKVIQSATDTIPILSGLCMTVFAAGLAPWAARTALSWMSSIMKGAI